MVLSKAGFLTIDALGGRGAMVSGKSILLTAWWRRRFPFGRRPREVSAPGRFGAAGPLAPWNCENLSMLGAGLAPWVETRQVAVVGKILYGLANTGNFGQPKTNDE
jgi:hypothetical protein